MIVNETQMKLDDAAQTLYHYGYIGDEVEKIINKLPRTREGNFYADDVLEQAYRNVLKERA